MPKSPKSRHDETQRRIYFFSLAESSFNFLRLTESEPVSLQAATEADDVKSMTDGR